VGEARSSERPRLTASPQRLKTGKAEARSGKESKKKNTKNRLLKIVGNCGRVYDRIGKRKGVRATDGDERNQRIREGRTKFSSSLARAKREKRTPDDLSQTKKKKDPKEEER